MSFSPPSDWVDDAPKSRAGMIILGIGGGCLVLLLMAGAFVSFGTFAAGKSCCDFAEESMRQTMAPIQSMLDALGRGDDAGAYEALGEGYRQANTFEAFQAFVHAEGDLFIGGEASFVGSRNARRPGHRYLIVQIAEPKTGTVKGTATFLVTRSSPSKKGAAAEEKIMEIHVGIPGAVMGQQEVVEVLQAFVDAVGREDLEAARLFMDDEMSAEAFEGFVEAQSGLLDGGRVVPVEIHGEPPELEAVVTIVAPDGEPRGQASFSMRRRPSGLWKITAIRTGEVAPPLDAAEAPAERPAIALNLTGPLAAPEAEISGLAWYGDKLILLPQYPSRFEDSLFSLERSDLMAAVKDPTRPLIPLPLAFDDGGADTIKGFEGFEAIAFIGDRAYVAIETTSGAGFVAVGRVSDGRLTLDAAPRPQLAPQASVDNMSYEALLVAGDGNLAAMFEANGRAVNKLPLVRRFGADLTPLPDLPMTSIEYRITDATDADDQGFFWAINYFYPGEAALKPESDPVVERFGQGATHGKGEVVERLVELRYSPEGGVTRSERAPIQLELADKGRNWEGIARLGDKGLLLATDKFPKTLLSFVEVP